ncbi:uncharacterized protein [Oryza sativa Japonica Group]|uniref:Os07g0418000 protein n=2 Tax=Oryza sativa subsp. japonica TaxID=39947 RepID=Q7F0Q5_ORYSJ|nr:uncharacterized protein LOC4343029 isoform X1 [Oryza sativa Japonica Group]KAB8105159.1 hypothetical protein EE612_038729 [Oryza sativa]KAF2922458.1 hypothetical protein DAI22_07g115400 [Oryza sativa Japonica Group]BAC83355.2 unknown protein [Oryza sativa Japonica Group]BAG87392.1 unnamed protein product [Oryza sativa Japonica Group]BAG97066.1 unnamed protein product [Oryza sativa Japonica Group]
MGGDLYALDFDGVLCDSCGESSLSAVKAAKVRWPWVFEQVDAAMEEWIVEQMYTLRPVVETGYENLLLVRLLIEIRIPSARRSSVADGLSIQEILENWLKLKPTIMSEWNEDRDSLVDLFGSIRDDWIENDLSGWIGANRFYPGTADALKFSSSEVYIVTTKQGRFAEALLKELAGIEFPSERIYGLGTGLVQYFFYFLFSPVNHFIESVSLCSSPKVKVLQQLQQMPQHQGLTLHSCACAGELATSPVPTAADLRLILHKLHSVCELLRMAMEGNYVAAMGMRRLENSMTLMP